DEYDANERERSGQTVALSHGSYEHAHGNREHRRQCPPQDEHEPPDQGQSSVHPWQDTEEYPLLPFTQTRKHRSAHIALFCRGEEVTTCRSLFVSGTVLRRETAAASKMMRPARIVYLTRAKLITSCIGSPDSTTRSAFSPTTTRPLCARSPNRRAGLVVNVASSLLASRPARAMSWYSNVVSTDHEDRVAD